MSGSFTGCTWRILFATFLAAVAAVAACASRAREPSVRYPPRRPGCALKIFYADAPDVPGWDDIGKLELICHINDTEATCFNRVRVDACRMGGDIIYRLPKKPWRPREEVFGYRAMVAHTRPAPDKAGTGGAPGAEPPPPPATAEEAAGPVVPLTGPAAPRVDGGI